MEYYSQFCVDKVVQFTTDDNPCNCRSFKIFDIYSSGTFSGNQETMHDVLSGFDMLEEFTLLEVAYAELTIFLSQS